MSIQSNQISLNPLAIARALGFVAFLLVLASIGGQLSRFLLGPDYLKGFVSLFKLNKESNIPTFFSVLLMVIASSLLACIATLSCKNKIQDRSKWIILSLLFLYMAYDEAFQVHEMLSAPFAMLLGNSRLGIFYYAWVIPGIAAVLTFALFFLHCCVSLEKIGLHFCWLGLYILVVV